MSEKEEFGEEAMLASARMFSGLIEIDVANDLLKQLDDRNFTMEKNIAIIGHMMVTVLANAGNFGPAAVGMAEHAAYFIESWTETMCEVAARKGMKPNG